MLRKKTQMIVQFPLGSLLLSIKVFDDIHYIFAKKNVEYRSQSIKIEAICVQVNITVYRPLKHSLCTQVEDKLKREAFHACTKTL